MKHLYCAKHTSILRKVQFSNHAEKLLLQSDGSRRLSGSEFQAVGPPTAKARRPNVLRRNRGTVRKWRLADLRCHVAYPVSRKQWGETQSNWCIWPFCMWQLCRRQRPPRINVWIGRCTRHCNVPDDYRSSCLSWDRVWTLTVCSTQTCRFTGNGYLFHYQLNQNTVEFVVNMNRQPKRLTNRRRSEQPFYLPRCLPRGWMFLKRVFFLTQA